MWFETDWLPGQQPEIPAAVMPEDDYRNALAAAVARSGDLIGQTDRTDRADAGLQGDGVAGQLTGDRPEVNRAVDREADRSTDRKVRPGKVAITAALVLGLGAWLLGQAGRIK